MFYKATFDDFKLGTIYQERFGDDWITKVLNEEAFELNPGGFNDMSEIMYNLKRYADDDEEYYRIKYLDKDDIESLGFVLNDDTRESRYQEYVMGECYIFFSPKEYTVNVYIQIDDKLIRMFNGKVLNLNELVILLIQVGILESKIRNEKLNRYAEILANTMSKS